MTRPVFSILPTPASLLLALAVVSAPAISQLGPTGTQFWNEGSPGLASALQSDARFGAAVAAGDFDCSGFDDLAIGVPDADADDGGGVENVGYVMVLYGTWYGPTTSEHQLWDQPSLAAQLEETDDQFGEVLATGDFDGDGCDDLAIGAPHEDIGTETDAGGVQIVYGSFQALSDIGNTYFRQGVSGVPGAAEAFDSFGSALAAGDFDADGFDDLAISAPRENLPSNIDGGVVHILFGSASGLTAIGNLLLYRGHPLPGSPADNERLGAALAVGQFGGMGPGADLVIGAPFSSFNSTATEEGRVLVYRDVGSDVFIVNEYTQSTPGVPGVSEDGDHFGWALATGDFDGDGFDELAVGSPGENLEAAAVSDAGAVTVLDVLSGAHYLLLQEDFPFEEPSDNDLFGLVLAAGDFDADGFADLAIGVPYEDLGPVLDTGIVHVLHGAAGSGLDAAMGTNWIQTLDPSENDDAFGSAIVAGQFSGHSGADLAIGAPGETLSGLVDAGGVNLLLSESLFLDGFESADTSRWFPTQN